jgi:hypothetical protein
LLLRSSERKTRIAVVHSLSFRTRRQRPCARTTVIPDASATIGHAAALSEMRDVFASLHAALRKSLRTSQCGSGNIVGKVYFADNVASSSARLENSDSGNASSASTRSAPWRHAGEALDPAMSSSAGSRHSTNGCGFGI